MIMVKTKRRPQQQQRHSSWLIVALQCWMMQCSMMSHTAQAWILPPLTTTQTTTATHRIAITTPPPASSSALAVAAEPSQQSESSSTSPRLNPLLSVIQPSKTVEIFSRVKQLQAEGVSVTSLCVGEPDFPPSTVVLDALHAAVTAGETKYTAVTGTLELRRAIAHDLATRKDTVYNPLTDIVVSNGAKQAVYQSILAMVGPGDAVLVPAPYWPSYPEMVSLTGAQPVVVETPPETGYLLDPAVLRATLEADPRIRLVILCNPSNPTGGVYTDTELSALVTVLKDFPQVAVVADEIYERLVYTADGTCPSVAAYPGMWDRTLTINGFSKAHAMTGLRLGYVAAPPAWAKAVATLQSQFTSCAGSLAQAAGVAALTQVPESELEEQVRVMRRKRDLVWDALAEMPFVKLPPRPPQGAFYILAQINSTPTFGMDDTALCQALLEDQRLALVPGSSFGAPGTVRLSYATSVQELETALSKLRTFLEAQTTTA